jgi:hypothetical protein
VLKRVELGQVVGPDRSATVMIRQDESAKHTIAVGPEADEVREISVERAPGQGRFAKLVRAACAGKTLAVAA